MSDLIMFDAADQKQDHTGTWVRAEAVQKRIEALTAEVDGLRKHLEAVKQSASS
jgi:hypothetical protein